MLRKFQDLYKGETCLILGNGPSLAKSSRELLDRYKTFGANKIFLTMTAVDRLHANAGHLAGFVPDFYTVVDEHMIHYCTKPLVNGYWPREAAFVRRGYPVPNSYQVRVQVDAGFSLNADDRVIIGGTVTYVALQLAYYMGFGVALLAGIDHKYSQTEQVQPGSTFLAAGEDLDHWHRDYFEAGEIYAAPELGGTIRSYQTANMAWLRDGRKIINLTPGSGLPADIIPHGKESDWL